MTARYLIELVRTNRAGRPEGITSVCSAHPVVIEAALLEAMAGETACLIEATCNQVNQEGGYTGMTPADFRAYVQGIAARIGFPADRLILGGDHLGPNPWKAMAPEDAMARAEAMVRAFVEAGFVKIHLDASMGCVGEPATLADEVTAERSARMARAAEEAAQRAGLPPPCYVIGTEVPPPGGALEVLEHLEVTRPQAAARIVAVQRQAFHAGGLDAAFERVIGLVVQPGVEFGHENVIVYDRAAARSLGASLATLPPLVFEAHSTDYQPTSALMALVQDGFAILKVGPGLTFALREALYALDQIAIVLDPAWREHSLMAAMERLMLAEPGHWRAHCPGTPDQQRILRHFSYSDRIRYYWPAPAAKAAVAGLIGRLGTTPVPETLISQFLPTLHPRALAGTVRPEAPVLAMEAVRDVLRSYARAGRG